jgi:hypothetical protein
VMLGMIAAVVAVLGSAYLLLVHLPRSPKK